MMEVVVMQSAGGEPALPEQVYALMALSNMCGKHPDSAVRRQRPHQLRRCRRQLVLTRSAPPALTAGAPPQWAHTGAVSSLVKCVSRQTPHKSTPLDALLHTCPAPSSPFPLRRYVRLALEDRPLEFKAANASLGMRLHDTLYPLKQLCFNPKVHRPLRARSDRSSDSGGGGPAAARWGIR